MKISIESAPILGVLNEDFREAFKNVMPASIHDIEPFKVFMSKMKPLWSSSIGNIMKNVYMPTNTYVDAVKKSEPAFSRSFTKGDIEKLVSDSFGCIVTKGTSYLYAYTHEYQFSIMMIEDMIAAAMWQRLDGTDDKTYDYFWYVTQNQNILRVLGVDGIADKQNCAALMTNTPVYFVMMERYASVEDVVLKPHEKYRGDNNERHVNLMGFDVKRRDSTWFTSVCREESFLVSGHLRLQPIKGGHKLIYINPFEKHGYHRQAKILNEHDNV